MTSEYRALVAKVEAFTLQVARRRADDLACRAGCAACCAAGLTVSEVEAEQVRRALAELPREQRERLRARGRAELARSAATDAPDERCALLDDAGCCAIYAARPLVCRTQGHALRYPAGFVPTEAVMRKTASGEVTWCPLNYERRGPNAEDILDAERVDAILSIVARRYASEQGHEAERRVALSALAAEADVLHDEASRFDESDR